mgnify:CR=1 FL=1
MKIREGPADCATRVIMDAANVERKSNGDIEPVKGKHFCSIVVVDQAPVSMPAAPREIRSGVYNVPKGTSGGVKTVTFESSLPNLAGHVPVGMAMGRNNDPDKPYQVDVQIVWYDHMVINIPYAEVDVDVHYFATLGVETPP